MGYCTQSDIENSIRAERLVELTADTGTTINVTVLSDIITKASLWMDSFLCGKYNTPITAAGDVLALVPHCITVVCYRLWARAGFPGRENPFESDYIATREWLKGFSPGGSSTLPSDTAAVDDTGSWGSEAPMFSGEDLVP
jgi:phage gp36-like protein